jgi:hypothetical protein
MITNRFSKYSPVSCAQGRHGELIVVQGGDVRPARWDGSGAAVDAGMDPPTSPPSISKASDVKYYIARVDINKPGACYYSPPPITFQPQATIMPPRHRPAKAAAFLSQAAVSEAAVLDGGKYYPDPPAVLLGDTHGKGAIIEAVLDAPADTDPKNSRRTGVTNWEVVSQPVGDASKFAAGAGGDTLIEIKGNGTFTVSDNRWYRNNDANPGYACGFGGATGVRGYSKGMKVTVSGWKSGTGAVLRLQWTGATFIANCSSTAGANDSFFTGATQVTDASANKFGAGYADDSKITVTLTPVSGELSQPIVIEGMTNGNPDNAAGERYSVKELVIKSGGSGYVVTPQIKITSNTGFGAYATCTISNGKIASVTLENSGGGYATPPKVEVLSGGAEAFAIARPHLRGVYQCYYRYVDDTPEERGGPIPSNLSPVAEVDAGEGVASISWTVPAPSGRAKKAELWRSTSNEALTLYRVASVEAASFLDDLTDEELRDPDRAGYAAMPIVLPNGEINAMRFTPPPRDKAVVVRFQDRFWYGVDTGGSGPNAIYFSEIDEPESVPTENEIVLQQNARDADSVRALIPYGSVMLVMQSRHAFSLSFVRQPLLDAQVSPVAYRGALNQRCWDIYAGECYVLDQYGVYTISPSGEVSGLSDPIDNLFRTEIDFGKSAWNFLVVDAKRKILRAFVAFRDDASTGYPTRALCYSIDSKTWWIERYPHQITGGTQVRLSNGDFRCAYGATGGAYLLGEGRADAGRGAVIATRLTNGGLGYKTPPKITAVSQHVTSNGDGVGAEFEAVVNGEGRLTAIFIKNGGYGYGNGTLVIEPPNDPSCPAPVRATATYTASPINADTPLFPVYRYKGGCAEYVNDSQDPKAAAVNTRHISLAYDPQPASCELSMRLYYNNSKWPRGSAAGRNRGVGFTHAANDAGARLDMGAESSASGVARSLYSGRTTDDMQGADRNVAVELTGARKTAAPVVFYTLDVYGAAE